MLFQPHPTSNSVKALKGRQMVLVNEHFTGQPRGRYQNVSIPHFIGAEDDGSGGDNWSCKTCKAPVKSSPPTNQQPTFHRLDALPVTHPTVSKHWRETLMPDKQQINCASMLLYSCRHCEVTIYSDYNLTNQTDFLFNSIKLNRCQQR